MNKVRRFRGGCGCRRFMVEIDVRQSAQLLCQVWFASAGLPCVAELLCQGDLWRVSVHCYDFFFVFCNPVLSAVALLCQGATTCLPKMSKQKRCEEKELPKERDAKRKSCEGTEMSRVKRKGWQKKETPREKHANRKRCQGQTLSRESGVGRKSEKGVISEKTVTRKRFDGGKRFPETLTSRQIIQIMVMEK